MTDRRRNAFVLLLVAGLVIVSLLVVTGIPGVVAAKKTRLGLDSEGRRRAHLSGEADRAIES